MSIASPSFQSAASGYGGAAEVWRIAATTLLWLTPLTALVVVSGVAYPAVVPRAVFFRTVITGASAIAVALLLLRGLRSAGTRDPVGFALLAFFGVSVLAALWGHAPIHSLFGDLQRMGGVLSWFYLLAFYWALRGLFGEREWQVYFRIAVGVVLLVAGATVAQVTMLGYPSATVTSFAGNTGYLAALAYMGVAISAYLLVAGSSALWRAAALLGLLSALATLFLLAQRSPLLGLGIATLWGCGVLWLLSPRQPGRWWAAIGAGGVLVLAAIAWLARDTALLQSLPVVRRVTSIQETDGRLHFWEAGIRAFFNRPLLGWGPENFDVAFNRHFPLEVYRYYGASFFVDRAHNSYLEAAVASGILGLVAFAAIWTAVLYSIAAAWRAGRMSRPEVVVLSSAFVGYIVYLFLWFEDLSSFILVVALAAFVAHRAQGPLLQFSAPLRWDRRRAALLLVLLTGLSFLWYRHAVRVALAASAVGTALDPRADAPVEAQLAEYRRALDLGVPEAGELLEPYAEFLASFEPDLNEVRARPDLYRALDSAVQHAILHLDAQIGRNRENDRWWLLRGRLLRLAAGLYQDPRYHFLAVEATERAVGLAPAQLANYYDLAETHSRAGQLREAHRALERARRVYDGLGETFAREAELYLKEGNIQQAEASLRGAWARGHWGTERLVGLVAGAHVRDGQPAVGADFIWEYLRGKYAPQPPGLPVRKIPEPSRDATLARAVSGLFLQGGEVERAREAAAWSEDVGSPGRRR